MLADPRKKQAISSPPGMSDENLPQERRVVRIEVGDLRLAVAAETVREVLGSLEVMPVPAGPVGLVGVVPCSGRAVAALDLAALVSGQPGTRARARTVLVETPTATLAIPADRVHQPAPVEAERAAHAVRMPHARVEVDVAGQTMPLFDLGDFVAGLEGAS